MRAEAWPAEVVAAMTVKQLIAVCTDNDGSDDGK